MPRHPIQASSSTCRRCTHPCRPWRRRRKGMYLALIGDLRRALQVAAAAGAEAGAAVWEAAAAARAAAEARAAAAARAAAVVAAAAVGEAVTIVRTADVLSPPVPPSPPIFAELTPRHRHVNLAAARMLRQRMAPRRCTFQRSYRTFHAGCSCGDKRAGRLWRWQLRRWRSRFPCTPACTCTARCSCCSNRGRCSSQEGTRQGKLRARRGEATTGSCTSRSRRRHRCRECCRCRCRHRRRRQGRTRRGQARSAHSHTTAVRSRRRSIQARTRTFRQHGMRRGQSTRRCGVPPQRRDTAAPRVAEAGKETLKAAETAGDEARRPQRP